MDHRKGRRLCALLAALCLTLPLWGCARDKQPDQTEFTAPTKGYSPILPAATKPQEVKPVELTPVYVSVFENTAILATVPLDEYNGLEPECNPREISTGGRICCDGDHEDEFPITKVIIADHLIPQSCEEWFRDMIWLESIEGLEKLHVEKVDDMSEMFSGCRMLTKLDIFDWDVSNVKDMTGMFDGCNALTLKPEWYQPEEE